ncbi:MAG: hypothetical protein AB1473_16935 [Thermodesulfobacteriota bacterium]
MESEQVWTPTPGWRVLISTFFIFVALGLTPQSTPAASDRTASVEAVEGRAEIPGEGEGAQEPLQVGHLVSTWQTVTTGQDGKLLLRWDLGILSSQGALSTLFMSSRAANGGEAADFQLVEGVLRISTDERKGGPAGPYGVTTPTAYIQPVSLAEPVDFIVETYDPSSTVVTVLRGQVEVRNLSVEGAPGSIVQSCRSVQIKEGKADAQPLEVYAEDAERLVTAATIPGSPVARLDTCPSRTAAAMPPVQPPVTAQPAAPYYVQEDYLYDPYPFDDIVVYPPPRARAGIVVFLPTIGEWIIPYEVYRTWGVGPDLILICVRRMLFDRALYYDHYYWNYYRVRQAELYRMAYFGQLAGDRGTLRRVLRELDDLRIRQNWLAWRIHRLEDRVRDLARHEGRLPARARMNLVNSLANDFDGHKNLHVSQKFQQGLRNRIEAQGRLAGIAGQELSGLRSRLSEERDPLRRAAVRTELTDARRIMAEGKMPIPAKDQNVRNLVNEISREQDPKKREDLQRQALKQLGGPQPTQPDLFAQENLNKLQKELTRFPNPRAVPQLEKQFTELKQAVETRRSADATRDKVELVLSKAAESKDPQDRGKMLQQIKELAPPVAAAAGVGLLPRVLEQQRLQNQLTVEQDRKKREELQQRLQEGLKKPPALAIQPTDPTKKPPDKTSLPSVQQPAQPPDQIRRAEQERLRLQQQEKQRQADKMRLQQEDAARKAAQERQKLEGLKKQEAEKAQIQRQQQEQAAQKAEQARRQQEEAARKAALDRQKLQEQQKKEDEKAQIQHRQQEQAAQKAEQMRQQQEKAARQAEQVRRQQQEQAARQAEQMRKQQQEQARQAQQAQQLKLQQQQAARQAEQMRRQQQEQAARQAQQAQQMKLQQQQQAAQQAAQAQARQRAEAEKKRQAELQRKQQEEAAKQAERLKK